MADYVKRKIVEKLARFTKDLKPADISLSFLTGNGVLLNLELDAEFITEVLRLPPWIRISRVVCDTIRAHVPFTSLRNDPVRFSVGKVEIEVSTCTDEGPRKKHTNVLDQFGSNTPSKYGFIEKVIDGMRVEIHSILIRFQDPTFTARLEMTDIVIQSVTPAWKPAPLPHTRMKNVDEDSIIIFKMCSWNNLKVEANSAVKSISSNAFVPTQLRLIAGETKIQVALKRRIADCAVLYTRASVHLGDVVWIVSQSQLRAVSKLIQSFLEAALKTSQQSRESSTSPEPTSGEAKGGKKGGKKAEGKSAKTRPKVTPREKAFQQTLSDFREGKRNLPPYEVIQDSFHLRTGKVDLQLCDDTTVGSTVEGSMLIQLLELVVDVYFDQPARSGRNHWNKANDLISNNVRWSQELIEKASKTQQLELPSISLPDLQEKGVVVRCTEFTIEALRTGKRSDASTLPIITSDKKTFSIPENIHNPAFQVGITMYHYPAECGDKFLVPRPNVNIYFSPVHVNVHQQSCLWLAEFVHGVAQTVNIDLALSVHDEGKTYIETKKAKSVQVPQLPGVDIKFSILFIKVTIPLPKDAFQALHIDDRRPRAIQVETAAIDVKNFSLDTLLKEETFAAAVDRVRQGWLFTREGKKEFPHFDNDLSAMPDRLKKLLNYRERLKMAKEQGGNPVDVPFNSELMATEGWHVHTSCVHVSFAESYTHEATLYTKTFIQDFPLHLWVFLPTEDTTSPPPPDSNLNEPTFCFIAHAPDVVHAELERLQLLFIMRLKDSFADFKDSLKKFLTLKSVELPAQKPLPSSDELAQCQTPPTREEPDKEEEEEEGEEEERRDDVERAPSRSSNKLKDISASIGGCVIVHSVVADIVLPSLHTGNNSKKVSNSKAVTPVPVPLTSEAGLSSPQTKENRQASSDALLSEKEGRLTSHPRTPSPRLSSSSSQTSIASSQASSSNVSSSLASLPLESPHPPAPDPPHSATSNPLPYSQHYSSTSHAIQLPKLHTKLHIRSLSASHIPTVTVNNSFNASLLNSISAASETAFYNPSPLGVREHSTETSTISDGSTTVTQEQKTSADIMVPNPASTGSNPPERSRSSVNSSTSASSVRDMEIDEGFLVIESPAARPSHSSMPESCQPDTHQQLQVLDKPRILVEPGTPAVAKRKAEGDSADGSLSRQPDGSKTLSKSSSRLSLVSRRSKMSSPILIIPKYIVRLQVQQVCALPTVHASSDITIRACVHHLDLAELDAKEFEQSRSEFGNRRPGDTKEDQYKGRNPEIKVRLELGDQVQRFFPKADSQGIDAIVIGKAEDVSVSLLTPSGPLLKDFFDDELESIIPMPIHLRIDNTKVTLKDEPQHTADNWSSLTFHIDRTNLCRGAEVEGVDLFCDGSHQEEEREETRGNKLLQSFRSFIDVFEAHVSRHGEMLNVPRPDHVAGLLHELQSSLQEQVPGVEAPPSYVEAVSGSRGRSQSITSEIQRLRRENEELKEQKESLLLNAQRDRSLQQSEFDWVTEECKRAKEQLVAYKQVIEKQQLQIERLACGQNVDTRMLSYHLPS